MLFLENIEKSVTHQGGRLWLSRQITLGVSEGEFLRVVGPSGSGKTTRLNIAGMCGYDSPGGFGFRGEPVHALKPARIASMEAMRHE